MTDCFLFPNSYISVGLDLNREQFYSLLEGGYCTSIHTYVGPLGDDRLYADYLGYHITGPLNLETKADLLRIASSGLADTINHARLVELGIIEQVTTYNVVL